MRSALCIGLLSLVASTVTADSSVGGFVLGGLSFAGFESEDSSGDRLELDNGVGINLSGGIRFRPAMMVKADFTYTDHDGGEFSQPAISFSDDVELSEFRLGFFWAPPHNSVAGIRLGGGYQNFSFEVPSSDFENDLDGLFLEAAVLLKAGDVTVFDLGGALMGLEDDNGEDASGLELRGGVTFKAGPVDIGATLRTLMLDTDFSGGGSAEDTYTDFRITVGTTWGYPGR